jgi:hypothetical protein
MRRIIAQSADGSTLWEAREILLENAPSFKRWISSGSRHGGLIEHFDMKSVLGFYVQYYPETYRVDTTWGKSVFIESLIPGALADLAVKALAE